LNSIRPTTSPCRRFVRCSKKAKHELSIRRDGKLVMGRLRLRRII
jgi:hypothetical protein